MAFLPLGAPFMSSVAEWNLHSGMAGASTFSGAAQGVEHALHVGAQLVVSALLNLCREARCKLLRKGMVVRGNGLQGDAQGGFYAGSLHGLLPSSDCVGRMVPPMRPAVY